MEIPNIRLLAGDQGRTTPSAQLSPEGWTRGEGKGTREKIEESRREKKPRKRSRARKNMLPNA